MLLNKTDPIVVLKKKSRKKEKLDNRNIYPFNFNNAQEAVRFLVNYKNILE